MEVIKTDKTTMSQVPKFCTVLYMQIKRKKEHNLAKESLSNVSEKKGNKMLISSY